MAVGHVVQLENVDLCLQRQPRGDIADKNLFSGLYVLRCAQDLERAAAHLHCIRLWVGIIEVGEVLVEGGLDEKLAVAGNAGLNLLDLRQDLRVFDQMVDLKAVKFVNLGDSFKVDDGLLQLVLEGFFAELHALPAAAVVESEHARCLMEALRNLLEAVLAHLVINECVVLHRILKRLEILLKVKYIVELRPKARMHDRSLHKQKLSLFYLLRRKNPLPHARSRFPHQAGADERVDVAKIKLSIQGTLANLLEIKPPQLRLLEAEARPLPLFLSERVRRIKLPQLLARK